jgi:hypothetical protein
MGKGSSREEVKKRRKKPKPSSEPNPGLPDEATVISEREFTSPKGKRYRIIKTTQRDPYDPPDDDERGGM